MLNTWTLIKILLIFFVSYFALFGLYQGYLHYYNEVLHQVDPITHSVAYFASNILNWFQIDSQVVEVSNKPYSWLYIDGEYATIVNEGCNGVSIGITMISFILAFHSNFKNTFFYLLVSLIIFYLINVFRVVGLSYVYRYHPDNFSTTHDIIFPVIVYGYIIFTWLVWLKYFVVSKKK